MPNGKTIAQNRQDMLNKDPPKETVALIAGKAENTKFGRKCRETWSASAVFRELQSESEANLRPLAAMTPGVSLREDEVRLRRKMSNMGKSQATGRIRHTFVSSQDVSSWSPRMPRKLFTCGRSMPLGTAAIQ